MSTRRIATSGAAPTPPPMQPTARGSSVTFPRPTQHRPPIAPPAISHATVTTTSSSSYYSTGGPAMLPTAAPIHTPRVPPPEIHSANQGGDDMVGGLGASSSVGTPGASQFSASVDRDTAEALLRVKKMLQSVDQDLATAQTERESIKTVWQSQLMSDAILADHYERHASTLNTVLTGQQLTALTDVFDDRPIPAEILSGLGPDVVAQPAAAELLPGMGPDLGSAVPLGARPPTPPGRGRLELFHPDPVAQQDMNGRRQTSVPMGDSEVPSKAGGRTGQGGVRVPRGTDILINQSFAVSRAVDWCRGTVEAILFDLQHGLDAFRSMLFDTEASVLSLELQRSLTSSIDRASEVLSHLADATGTLRELRDSAVEQDDRVASTEAKMYVAREAALACTLERDTIKSELWSHRAAQKMRLVAKRRSRRAASSASDVRAASPESELRHRSRGREPERLAATIASTSPAADLGAPTPFATVATVVHVSIDSHSTLWERHGASMTAAVPLFKEALLATLAVEAARGMTSEDRTTSVVDEAAAGVAPWVSLLEMRTGDVPAGGDGCYAQVVFRDATAAVRWATAFQLVLNVLPWPSEFATAAHHGTMCPAVSRSDVDLLVSRRSIKPQSPSAAAAPKKSQGAAASASSSVINIESTPETFDDLDNPEDDNAVSHFATVRRFVEAGITQGLTKALAAAAANDEGLSGNVKRSEGVYDAFFHGIEPLARVRGAVSDRSLPANVVFCGLRARISVDTGNLMFLPRDETRGSIKESESRLLLSLLDPAAGSPSTLKAMSALPQDARRFARLYCVDGLTVARCAVLGAATRGGETIVSEVTSHALANDGALDALDVLAFPLARTAASRLLQEHFELSTRPLKGSLHDHGSSPSGGGSVLFQPGELFVQVTHRQLLHRCLWMVLNSPLGGNGGLDVTSYNPLWWVRFNRFFPSQLFQHTLRAGAATSEVVSTAVSPTASGRSVKSQRSSAHHHVSQVSDQSSSTLPLSAEDALPQAVTNAFQTAGGAALSRSYIDQLNVLRNQQLTDRSRIVFLERYVKRLNRRLHALTTALSGHEAATLATHDMSEYRNIVGIIRTTACAEETTLFNTFAASASINTIASRQKLRSSPGGHQVVDTWQCPLIDWRSEFRNRSLARSSLLAWCMKGIVADADRNAASSSGHRRTLTSDAAPLALVSPFVMPVDYFSLDVVGAGVRHAARAWCIAFDQLALVDSNNAFSRTNIVVPPSAAALDGSRVTLAQLLAFGRRIATEWGIPTLQPHRLIVDFLSIYRTSLMLERPTIFRWNEKVVGTMASMSLASPHRDIVERALLIDVGQWVSKYGSVLVTRGIDLFTAVSENVAQHCSKVEIAPLSGAGDQSVVALPSAPSWSGARFGYKDVALVANRPSASPSALKAMMAASSSRLRRPTDVTGGTSSGQEPTRSGSGAQESVMSEALDLPASGLVAIQVTATSTTFQGMEFEQLPDSTTRDLQTVSQPHKDDVRDLVSRLKSIDGLLRPKMLNALPPMTSLVELDMSGSRIGVGLNEPYRLLLYQFAAAWSANTDRQPSAMRDLVRLNGWMSLKKLFFNVIQGAAALKPFAGAAGCLWLRPDRIGVSCIGGNDLAALHATPLLSCHALLSPFVKSAHRYKQPASGSSSGVFSDPAFDDLDIDDGFCFVAPELWSMSSAGGVSSEPSLSPLEAIRSVSTQAAQATVAYSLGITMLETFCRFMWRGESDENLLGQRCPLPLPIEDRTTLTKCWRRSCLVARGITVVDDVDATLQSATKASGRSAGDLARRFRQALRPVHIFQHSAWLRDLVDPHRQQGTLSASHDLLRKQGVLFFDLIVQLLDADPRDRMTVEGALRHPFFEDVAYLSEVAGGRATLITHEQVQCTPAVGSVTSLSIVARAVDRLGSTPLRDGSTTATDDASLNLSAGLTHHHDHEESWMVVVPAFAGAVAERIAEASNAAAAKFAPVFAAPRALENALAPQVLQQNE